MCTYLTSLMLLASLALVACGGGNDVASSGATAVSAAAAPSAVSKPATPTTEPKVNGQVDERTGVAPVVAQMSIAQTVTACTASATYGGTGALLTTTTAPTLAQCATALPGYATGNPWTVYSNTGCGNSSNFSGRSGPASNQAQQTACFNAINFNAPTYSQCNAYGGIWYGSYCSIS